MWLMFARFEPPGLEPAILIVDHVGEPRHVASSVEEALSWLGSAGLPEVGVPVAGGIEVYRIEPAGPPRLARRALAHRRTLPPAAAAVTAPAGGVPTAPYLEPAGNRRARRKAGASLRRQGKRRRHAGP